MFAKKKEQTWFVKLTGAARPSDQKGKKKTAENENDPSALEQEAEDYDQTQQAKDEALRELNIKLEGLREAIRKGQTYVLEHKGKKIQSIVDSGSSKGRDALGVEPDEEVETWEDMAKSKLLDPEIQKEIFQAQAEVSKLSKRLETMTRPGSKEPLFDESEITEELWTPLMREKVMPDNAIPAKYSKVQKTFENSSKLYMDKLDQIAVSSGAEDVASILGDAKEFVMAAGELAKSIEKACGAPELSGLITKGIQVGLAAGMGIAKGALEKASDDVVSNCSDLIKLVVTSAVSSSLNNDLLGKKIGAMTAAGFTAACKVPQIVEDLSKDPPQVGDILAHLGEAIASGMGAADPTNAANGPVALMGRSIAGALQGQKAITNMVQEAVVNKQKPNAAMIVAAFTKAAASACGTVLTIGTEIENKPKELAAEKIEEEKKQAEEEKKALEKELEELKAESNKAEQGSGSEPKSDGETGQGGEGKPGSEEANKAEQNSERETRIKELEAEIASKEMGIKEMTEKGDKLFDDIEKLDWKTERAVEAIKGPGEEHDKSAEKSKEKAKDEKQEAEAEKQREAKREEMEKKLKELKGVVQDPEAMKKLDAKLKKLEEENAAKELSERSAEFQAMLEEMVPPGVDGDEREAALEFTDTHSIDRLIAQMEADKAIIETFMLIVDTLGATATGVASTVAAQLLPPVGVVVHMKDFILSCLAAIERAAQFNEWLDNLEDAQNSMSPYAPAMKNRVKNSKIQLSQKSLEAALQLAQALGCASACSGMDAGAGMIVEKAAAAGEAAVKLIYEIAEKAEMAYQWGLFKKAYQNPQNRRLGKEALKGNPSLSKYALAYGALVDGDDNARKAMNRCGLTDQVLANKDASVGKVVKYLETMFEDDPTLYRPSPKKIKDIEPAFTYSNLQSVKTKMIKELGDGDQSKLGALLGHMANVAKAEKNFKARKSQVELDDCHKAIDVAVVALRQYNPKQKKDGLPQKEMQDYVADMIELGEARKGDLTIEFGRLQAAK
jgi:hypothetical protein